MAAPHNSPDSDLIAAKREARRCAMARRAGQDPALGLRLGAHLLRDLPPPSGAAVAGFWPMDGEIDIRPLLVTLHGRGHPILLPRTPRIGEPLTFLGWSPGMALVRERFGTWRPTGAPGRPDWLLVPLLAFDRCRRRLGYGGGFYDRTLAGLPGAVAIGCAFAAQETDRVPTGAWDRRLDAVATERGTRRCGTV